MVEVFTLLCYNYFDKSEFVEGIMAREINPKDTSRAMAFELWMQAPNPMVTFFKTIDKGDARAAHQRTTGQGR